MPRTPVVYLPHGGGPWPFFDLGMPAEEVNALATYLKGLAQLPPTPPKALLVISAHWEEPVPTVMSSPQPPMLYDYYGFPPGAYKLTWPAPGDPALADRVRQLLGEASFDTASHATRGFDHGTFIPLMLAYPEASIPTVQLSLVQGLDPRVHLALGRALAPLRDEGVFIIGSGMSFHNMRAIKQSWVQPHAEAFDQWLHETARLAPTERDAQLAAWSTAPSARTAHPREEHLLPLMVAAGAAGDDVGSPAWTGTMLGWQFSAVHFG